MRATFLLAWIAPLVALVGCDAGEPIKVPQDDTAIGVDDDTGGEDLVADIVVDPLELDLGVTAPGVALTGSFSISNVGSGTLSATVGVSAGGDRFGVDSPKVVLEPGVLQNVVVTLQADGIGTYTGVVHIGSNDPDEGGIDIPVSGRVAEVDDDLDDDGWLTDQDCDDTDPTVNPGATDTWYDGVDQDCDGRSDFDQDGDGADSDAYGGADCDDLDAAVGPGTLEDPTNGVDDDCDGEIDEAPSTVDLDGDGYAESEGDCDDADATVNPGAIEAWYDGLDQDCSGGSDYDADYDGYESDAYGGDDCDDTAAAVNPGALEIGANGVDDDCDGAVDTATDDDGDGYTEIDNDCDDADASVNPGAAEVWYDGVDQDCDGNDLDQDGDGYVLAYDCDDTDAALNPGAVETWYDGVDQDCAGDSDYDQDGDGEDADAYGGADCDDLDATINTAATEAWYDGVDQDCAGDSDYDQDADGYDSADYGGTDCDDTDALTNPGALEVWYDGVDGDCAGGSDYDADGDGFDADAYGGTDCDDADAAVYVGASDTWYDGVDANCDGASDYDRDADGSDSSAYGGTDCNDLDPSVYVGAADAWYDGVDSNCSGGSDYDQDGDGYSSSTYGGTDCADTVAAVNPGAVEVWYDGTDSDCSGGSDYDQDVDGYTSSTYGGLDCADTDAAISPGDAEVCDGVDNDCDGSVDETGTTTWYLDADSDGYGVSTTSSAACTAPAGYVATAGDCNDASASVSPGDVETCNGIDDDCDGTVDDGGGSTTYYRDADGDGYGDAASSTTSCTSTSGYVTNATDCNDGDATAYPGGTEVAYDVSDNDCDGYQDEMVAETESGWTVIGDGAGDAIGAGGVWVSDDLDGDGDPELVIGAAAYDYSSYYTTIGLTAFHDIDTDGLGVSVTDGYYTYYGNSSDDDMGQSFVVLDDLDGGGSVEVAFGAYQNDYNSTDDGSVYITDIYGESGSDTASYWYTDGFIGGDSSSGNYAYSMASGDFDGDGAMDLAAGAPGEQSSKGRVYVTFEDDNLGTDIIDNTDSTFFVNGVSNSDHLGYAVAFGDLNDDGYDDLVASSPDDDDAGSGSGTVWVVSGAATRDTSDVHGTTISSLDAAVITGSAASDGAGLTPQSLSVGDLDSDGRDDLAVGVPGYDGYTSAGGGIWVYVGGSVSGAETVSTANYVINGDGALGTAVNMTGDLTGDNTVDLLGGATTAGSSKGVVYLFEGGQAQGTYTMPTDQYASWTGKSSGDLFGAAISGLWDLDGDGILDFAVAATGNDDAASAAGKVYVIPAYP